MSIEDKKLGDIKHITSEELTARLKYWQARCNATNPENKIPGRDVTTAFVSKH